MLELVAETVIEGEARHLVLVEEVYSDDDEPFTLFVNADHYTAARRTVGRAYYWTLADAQAACLERFGVRAAEWRDAATVSFPFAFAFDFRVTERGVPQPYPAGFAGAEVVARLGEVEHPDAPPTRVLDLSGNRDGLRRLAALLLLVADGDRYDDGFHVHLEDEHAGEGREEPFLVGDVAITLRAPSYHDVLRGRALRQWSATVDLGGPGEASRPDA